MSDPRASDELHWKKELTALRKATRLLRDPETTCSLRTPLSSRSLAGISSLNYISGTRSQLTGRNQTGRYSELDSSSPLKCKNSQKQVFLYNWRQPPSKSSDNGEKLDGRRNYLNGLPIPGTPGNSSNDASKEGSKSDSYLDDPTVLYKVREENLMTTQKAIKKPKRSSAVSRQRVVRRSANSTLVDPASMFLGGPIPSIELSDDTEYCNSEDLRISTRDLMRKSGYTSKPSSPMQSRGENLPRSSKPLAKSQRDDSSFSCTPASTNSFNIYRKKSINTVESWDGTTPSLNGDAAEHLDLPRSQGCGIPCYWSKRTPKHRSSGGCYSPSLSDTLRRKGSSILCGSQTLHQNRRSSRSNKRKITSKSAQLPLLSNSCDGRGGSSTENRESDDELSTNCEEVDLEALSRLDGRRWSLSCGSQEGLEIVALAGTEQGTAGHVSSSLSQKYKPRFFDEIIGQNIVIQSLTNAVSKERIAPVYLFQGPRGTGKTSTARIFSAALNCMVVEETKPCGSCRECKNVISGKSMDLREVDATNKKGIDRLRYLLQSLSSGPPSHFSNYKVFIIDECHLLPTKTWSDFLKFLEEPPAHIVFIFITTDLDNLPRTVLSRCQKYIFNKIRDADIVIRLKKLSVSENLDVESHALHLIALNADGSLRDAETMLEQLSLLGKKITASLVNELVGVVPDEKLLDLLELAMSSDTAETVKKSRELMDSGVDPMALMSQLAGLIMDIIAGTYHLVDSKCSGSFFGGRSLTEAELERLKQALKLLLEAEKQLRLSSERSTWFTAALLQLGSVSSSEATNSSSSRRQSSKATDEDQSNTSWEIYANKKKSDAQHRLRKSTPSSVSSPGTVDEHRSNRKHPLQLVDSSSFGAKPPPCSRVVEGDSTVSPLKDTERKISRSINPENLDEIWDKCIERCHSKTLRQLLHAHARLVSISEVEGVVVAYIAVENADIKSRAERFLSSITNSMETVLRRNVDVRLGLRQEEQTSDDSVTSGFPSVSEDGNTNRNKPPMQRIQTIIDEQRLESAWLQAAETASYNRLKQPEKNQILPQDGHKDEGNWEDELNHEIKALKMSDIKAQTAAAHYPISPSILHNRANFNKESQGYESGASAGAGGGFLCWKTAKHSSNKGKQVKPGTPVALRLQKKKQFSCFGQCGKKTNKRDNKIKR